MSLLSVRGLTVKDGRGVTMVDNVSFDLRAGEIVGIAGVAGNGQSELLEAIAGIRRAAFRRGAPQWPADRRHRPTPTPRSCAICGLAHVPEDRHHVGSRAEVRGMRKRHPRLSP
ncbi:ATP-binding cassette domain-containing protein [Ensifer canadensis]